MAPIEASEFLTHVGYIREDLAEIKGHIAHQNGRIWKVEHTLGIHEERFDVMKGDNKAQAKSYAGRWGMLLAGVGASVELLRQWWGQ